MTSERLPYYAKAIDKQVAQSVSVENHYLHRTCPCTQAYGLFDKEKDILIGVILYGVPSSSTLKGGVCGDEEREHVIELKRLWVKDGVAGQPESYFIAQTLRLMRVDCPKYDIIISYADAGFGHKGVVYQATNWMYTGTSAPFHDWTLVGEDGEPVKQNHLTVCDILKKKYGTVAKAREALGDRMVRVERTSKYRYVIFNTNVRARRRELSSKLKYPILPYPKGELTHIVSESKQKSLEEFR